MNFSVIALLLIVGLLLGMLIAAEVGRRIGVARLERDKEGLPKGSGAAEAAVFALLGLLLAFTFSGAASRFEDRRHLITQEVNAIGTAWLRIDLLPGDAQPEMRDLFRRYLDSRLETYRNTRDLAAVKASLTHDAALQHEIWKKTVAAAQEPGAPTQVTILLLPALNQMIDITTSRLTAARNHPPPIVFILLVGLSLIGTLLVGYGTSLNRNRSWLHTLVFAAILTVTTYVIVDLEFPRFGLIRVDAADELLIELRESMN